MNIEANDRIFNVTPLVEAAPHVNKKLYSSALDNLKEEIKSIRKSLQLKARDMILQHRLISIFSDPLLSLNESFYDDQEYQGLVSDILNECLIPNASHSYWTPILWKLNSLEVQKFKKGSIHIELSRLCSFISDTYEMKSRKAQNYSHKEFVNIIEKLFKRLKLHAKTDVAVLSSIEHAATKYKHRIRLANIFMNISMLSADKILLFVPLEGRNLNSLDHQAISALIVNENFGEETTILKYLEGMIEQLNHRAKHPNNNQKNKFKTFLSFLVKLYSKKNSTSKIRAVILSTISVLAIKLKNAVTNRKEHSTVFLELVSTMLDQALGLLVHDYDKKYVQALKDLKEQIFYLVFYLLLADKGKKSIFEQILIKIEILYKEEYTDFVIGKLEKIYETDELNNKIIAEHLAFLSHSLLHRGYEDKVDFYIKHFIAQGYSEKDKITNFIIQAYYQLAYYRLKFKQDPSTLEAFLLDCVDKKWIFGNFLDISMLQTIDCSIVNVKETIACLISSFKANAAEKAIQESEHKPNLLFKGILRILLDNPQNFEYVYKNIRPNLEALNPINECLSDDQRLNAQDGQGLSSVLYFLNHIPTQLYKRYFSTLSSDVEKIISVLIYQKKFEDLEEHKKVLKNFINTEANSSSGRLKTWLQNILSYLSDVDILDIYTNDYKRFTFNLSLLNLITFSPEYIKLFGVTDFGLASIDINKKIIEYVKRNELFDGYLYKILTVQLSYLSYHSLYDANRKIIDKELKESKGIRSYYFDHIAKVGLLFRSISFDSRAKPKMNQLNDVLKIHYTIYIDWLFMLIHYLPKINPSLLKLLFEGINSRLIDPKLQQTIIDRILIQLDSLVQSISFEEFESSKDNFIILFNELLTINAEILSLDTLKQFLTCVDGFLTKNKEIDSRIGFLFSLVVFIIKKAGFHDNIGPLFQEFDNKSTFTNLLPALYKSINMQTEPKHLRDALESIQNNHKEILQGYFTKIQFSVLVNALASAKKRVLQISKAEYMCESDLSPGVLNETLSIKNKNGRLLVTLTNFNASNEYSTPISLPFFTRLIGKLKDVLTQNNIDFSAYQNVLKQAIQKAKLGNLLKYFMADELTLTVRCMFIADANSKAEIVSYLRAILKKDEEAWEKTKIAIFAAAYSLKARGLVQHEYDVLIEDYMQILFDNFKINHFNILFMFIRSIQSYNPELNKLIINFVTKNQHNRFTMSSLIFANNLDQSFNDGELFAKYADMLENMKYSNQNSLVFCLLATKRYLQITPTKDITGKLLINQFFIAKLLPDLEVSSSNYDIFAQICNASDRYCQSVEYANLNLYLLSKIFKYFTVGSSDDPAREKALTAFESIRFSFTHQQLLRFYTWLDDKISEASSVHSQMFLIDIFFNHAKLYTKEEFQILYDKVRRIVKQQHLKTKPYFEKRFNAFLKRQPKSTYVWYLETIENQAESLEVTIFYHFMLNFKFTALSLVNRYFRVFNHIMENLQLNNTERNKLNEALQDYTYLQTKFINLEDVVIDKEVVYERLKNIETKLAYHA